MAVAARSIHRTRRLKLQVFRTVVFVAAAVFFLVPIGAMVEFSTRGNSGQRTLEYWKEILAYPDMVQAIVASLELAAITSVVMLVLLVPTMVWVRLKLPRLSRIVELVHLGRANAGVSIAVAVASLLFAFVLLVVLAFIGARPRRMHRDPVAMLASPTVSSQK